jgi:hypothetical protein
LTLAGGKEAQDDDRRKKDEENAKDDRFLTEIQAKIDPRFSTPSRASRFRPASRLLTCSLSCSGTSFASHNSNVSGAAIIAWIMLTCRGSITKWEDSAIKLPDFSSWLTIDQS